MPKKYYPGLMDAIGPKPKYKPKTPCRNECRLPVRGRGKSHRDQVSHPGVSASQLFESGRNV